MNEKLVAERLAMVAIHHSLKRAKLGETDSIVVLTRGFGSANPLFLALQKEILNIGAYPALIPEVEDWLPEFLKFANERQAGYINPIFPFVYSGIFKARILLLSEIDPLWLSKIGAEDKGLKGIISTNLAFYNKAHGPFLTIMDQMDNTGQMAWLLMPWVTNGYAKLAGLTYQEYLEYFAKACFVDSEDFLERWEEFELEHKRLLEVLKNVKEIHVVGPGTNLQITIGGGRGWEASDGKRNIPAGEVFTSPESAEGKITCPVTAHMGELVEELVIAWKEGRVIDYTAKSGLSLVKKMLNMDPGASGIGEFGIGTNPGATKFTKSILFDEKMGGTCHVACGLGFSRLGGDSGSSSIHWDIVFPVDKIILDDKATLFWDGETWLLN